MRPTECEKRQPRLLLDDKGIPTLAFRFRMLAGPVRHPSHSRSPIFSHGIFQYSRS